MIKIELENATLTVYKDARYDLSIIGSDEREHHITGSVPPVIRDVHHARGVFQAMGRWGFEALLSCFGFGIEPWNLRADTLEDLSL